MKFLIVDEMHPSIIPLLESIGIEVDYQPQIRKSEIPGVISGAEGLVVRSKIFVDEDLLAHAGELKVICRAGAGIDNLDVEAIKSRGIKIVNAPEGNRNALAEHTLGLLLSLLNNIVKGDREVSDMVWDREGNRGYELSNLVVALIGYGNMGSAFADKVKYLAKEVLVYDKYKSEFSTDHVEEASLEEIYNKADVLSIHVPLTEETRCMFDEVFFSKFRKSIWLINTSRGEVMPLKDVVSLLKANRFRGVALDVLENEKINTFAAWEKEWFDHLVQSDKVILTPHVGGWSFESYERINRVLVKKLEEIIK